MTNIQPSIDTGKGWVGIQNQILHSLLSCGVFIKMLVEEGGWDIQNSKIRTYLMYTTTLTKINYNNIIIFNGNILLALL